MLTHKCNNHAEIAIHANYDTFQKYTNLMIHSRTHEAKAVEMKS